MDEGYTFVWPCGQLPYMIDENGLRIDLTVHDNIPYISLGTDECEPRKDHEASRIHSFLFDKNDDFNGEGTHRVFYIDSSSGDEVCDPNPESHKKKKLKRRIKKRERSQKSKVAAGEHYENPSDIWDEGNGDDPPGPPDDDAAPEDVPDRPDDAVDEDDDDPDVDGKDDDDTLEVDIVDGDARLAKRGTLKVEARSIEHKLTHRFKNPYCDSCVRAKMKHYKTHRDAFKRNLKRFGDLITFDLVDSTKVIDDGITLEKEVLVVRDRYAGIIASYIMNTVDSGNVVRAIKRFIGLRKCRQVYLDGEPAFLKAMEEMNNQVIITATATCLLEAGLPPCFWRTAIECVCHLLNPGKKRLAHGVSYMEKNFLTRRFYMVPKYSSNPM